MQPTGFNHRREGARNRLSSAGFITGAVLAWLLFGSVPQLCACSIPVFRYALDRWPADAYRLEVAPADARDEAVARFLRNFGAATPLNLEIARLPAPGTDAPSRLLPPHAAENGAPPVWSGSLAALDLATLTNSPVRREIVRRILEGECVVWVLVESGDRAADEAAAAKLGRRLQFLETVMQLPVIDPSDPSSQLGPGPALRVKFSLLRVRHDTAAEQPFLAMLAGPKSRLERSREPWVAAVFGRGRALGAWPAAGFGEEQIEEVTQFLLGACSCQVKRLNPGWDLLLAVDWDEALHAIGYAKPAARSARPGAGPQPEVVTISGGAASSPPPVPGQPVTDEARVLLAGVAVVLLIAGGFAWRRFA